jgi:uncharacterized membrane protein
VFLLFSIYVLTRLRELRRDVNELKERRARGAAVGVSAQPAEPIAARPQPAYAPVPSAPPPPAPAIPRRVTPPPVVAEAVVAKSSIVDLTAGLRPDGTLDWTPPPTPRPKPEPLPPSAPMPAAGVPTHAAGKRDLESLLGANWLAKLGIAAIAVAAALFLQYAFRSGWIGPKGQVAIGLSAAAVMLGAAQYLLTKQRYRSYAQVLASGGIVVYFLCIYAAYSFYHPRLLGLGPAFGALAVGALAASALALANNTEGVALLCILGAFATPVLIRENGSGATESLIRLYAYLGVLNLWVVSLTRLRPWHSLSVVAFTGTWLLFFVSGHLQSSGWQTEGFASLFLLASCYFGVRALYAQKAAQEGEGETALRDTMKVGLGLILGGCLAFAVASAVILTGPGLLGLSDVALAGLLLALLLAGCAVALPSLGRFDRPIRLLFGYLAAAALAVMMVTALETSAATPREQVPIAFGFALFNYLLFLATALVLHRQTEEEGPAAALAGANAVIHILIASHVLQATQVWGIPAAALWLPLAGLLSLGGLWIAARQRAEARLLPGTLIAAAQVLPLYGLIAALPAGHFAPAGRWPMWSVALLGAEFVLLSAAWLALRRRIAWPAFRADIAAAFGNAAVFFGLMARAVGTERVQGFSLLAGCAVAMAAYHALVGAVALRRDDRLHRLIYLGLATTFVAIAIPLQLKAGYITLAWAVEAAVLVWTGMRVNERRVRVYGLILLVLAAGRALFFDLTARPQGYPLLFNTRTLAGAAVIAAAYLSAWWLSKGREALTAQERRFPWDLCLLANLFTLLFVSVDLWDSIGQGWPAAAQPGARQLALTAFWTLYAVVGVCIAIACRFRPLRLFALGLLGFAAVKSLVIDITMRPEPVRLLLNTRMLAGALVIAGAYLSAWLLWQARETLAKDQQFREEAFLPAALGVLANLFTLLFVSVDLWDYAGVRWPKGGTASAQQLALSLFWTGYALAGVSVGIWKRLRPVRLFAMGLLYLAIGKVFLFDLRHLETPYRIVSFFTLGVILLLVSLLYTRFEERLHAGEELPGAETPHPKEHAA